MNKRFSLSVMALSLLIAVGLFSPVLAQETGDDTTEVTTQSTVESRKKSIEEAREAAKQKAEEAREAAKQELEDRKKNLEERTTEVRKQACESRRENIKNRLENISEFGERHKGTFDEILGRVEEFKTKKNLTVENEEVLLDNIQTAQDTVMQEVEALKDLKENVDCEDPDSVATALAAFKTQSSTLRDALKAYREAIRTYMQAVKASAESATSTDDDSSQTSSDSSSDTSSGEAE